MYEYFLNKHTVYTKLVHEWIAEKAEILKFKNKTVFGKDQGTNKIQGKALNFSIESSKSHVIL